MTYKLIPEAAHRDRLYYDVIVGSPLGTVVLIRHPTPPDRRCKVTERWQFKDRREAEAAGFRWVEHGVRV